MNARPDNSFEILDYTTSRTICDAIGERLQQSIRPDYGVSDRLRELLDELRRRDFTGA
ncbi:MAG: hypothetical protein ACRC1G_08935 [Bradyrhizobium sp.]